LKALRTEKTLFSEVLKDRRTQERGDYGRIATMKTAELLWYKGVAETFTGILLRQG
jgi:hypothetical protein